MPVSGDQLGRGQQGRINSQKSMLWSDQMLQGAACIVHETTETNRGRSTTPNVLLSTVRTKCHQHQHAISSGRLPSRTIHVSEATIVGPSHMSKTLQDPYL